MNRYLRVFSLEVSESCIADMVQRSVTEDFEEGSWSTATVRLLHPRTKCLALSRASATANASPSIGAYLDFAACVNLLQ